MRTLLWPWLVVGLFAAWGIAATVGWSNQRERVLLAEAALAKTAADQAASAQNRQRQTTAELAEAQAALEDLKGSLQAARQGMMAMGRPLQLGERLDSLTVPGRNRPTSGTVMSFAADSFALRTPDGIIGVPVISLPLELRARAALAIVTGSVSSSSAASSSAPPPAAPVVRQAEPPPAPETSAREATPDLTAIRRAAERRADTYFRYEYTPSSPATANYSVRVVSEEPETIPGWPGQWRVRGRGYVQGYDSSGGSFVRGDQGFEVILEVAASGEIKVLNFNRR